MKSLTCDGVTTRSEASVGLRVDGVCACVSGDGCSGVVSPGSGSRERSCEDVLGSLRLFSAGLSFKLIETLFSDSLSSTVRGMADSGGDPARAPSSVSCRL